MAVLKLILFPFAAIYRLITGIRNHLYDIGYKPSFQFDIPIICVGNLSAGGAGKTPMIEYLIRLLKDSNALVTLSRGFKRESQGFHIASDGDTSRSIGDEPFQLFRKFGNEIKVSVGEDRVFAIPHILQKFPETKIILLDDAMQHRRVRAQMNILVTECSVPFYEDYLLPAGRLRESRKGAKRADVIVVTKCNPSIAQEKISDMTRKIERYAGNKPVFFCSVEYDQPVAFNQPSEWSNNIVLVTGIGNAQPLVEQCSRFKMLKHFVFPDHHKYSRNDLDEIHKFCNQLRVPYSILTTEKDMVRLLVPDLISVTSARPWFYIPIRQKFINDGMKFDNLVVNALSIIRKG